MTKFIKKTSEQIERHRIVRKERRHNDQAYRERINKQSNLRYKKIRLQIILKELRSGGIKIDTTDYEVAYNRWKIVKRQQGETKRIERYQRNLESLKVRYNSDDEYRNRQLKKADKQYDERKQFVGTIVKENERLKKKIKEIENGKR